MTIRIEGASEHNLRDIDVAFEPGLTVVTGDILVFIARQSPGLCPSQGRCGR